MYFFSSSVAVAVAVAVATRANIYLGTFGSRKFERLNFPIIPATFLNTFNKLSSGRFAQNII